jgi:hypothetical protein
MNSSSNDHALALRRATEDLIEADESGLPIGRLAAAVAAARDQVLGGYRMLGIALPPPAEYVRTVIDLARKDIHAMRVPTPREDPNPLASA